MNNPAGHTSNFIIVIPCQLRSGTYSTVKKVVIFMIFVIIKKAIHKKRPVRGFSSTEVLRISGKVLQMRTFFENF